MAEPVAARGKEWGGTDAALAASEEEVEVEVEAEEVEGRRDGRRIASFGGRLAVEAAAAASPLARTDPFELRLIAFRGDTLSRRSAPPLRRAAAERDGGGGCDRHKLSLIRRACKKEERINARRDCREWTRAMRADRSDDSSSTVGVRKDVGMEEAAAESSVEEGAASSTVP